MLIGMIGWTRTAHHLWTNPDVYEDRETAPTADTRKPALSPELPSQGE